MELLEQDFCKSELNGCMSGYQFDPKKSVDARLVWLKSIYTQDLKSTYVWF